MWLAKKAGTTIQKARGKDNSETDLASAEKAFT
jgi:hypothetical protein